VSHARRPAALFIPVVAVAYSIKEVESYLRAILQWQLTHNFLSEIQRAHCTFVSACASCREVACAGWT
jgi:hypothetical protein